MRKILFVLAATIGFVCTSNAQDGSQTDQGSWLIEVNTGFGGGDTGLAHTANTGFGLTSIDGTTIWSIGGEGGYFIADNLAAKVGLGYSDLDGATIFSYKLGAKYYIINTIPVQLDVTGASIKDANENPLWLGLQGGYAIFIGDMVSIEPGLRYNLSLNEDFTDEGIFEFRIGFALHF
ncbi:hypothetical protein K1F50_08040 [Muricauda oceani]|uniref:Outer membrane protein beta-barrel domain-containing protein n=1 Tax=Flagellimonas oceani TaxID=2698672 RepID=A0A6G7J3X1_9FLAO|nr:hypothetical protein [Allomuricauda oceani]MBW8242749.1 hypothetical protein [Allomuricauda oceani]QII45515.1 hypothetical protein GVT53_12775 [Allomuricauda oceani]